MAENNIKKIQPLLVEDDNRNTIQVGQTGELVNYKAIENNDQNLTAYHLTQTQAALALKINELIKNDDTISEAFSLLMKDMTDGIIATFDNEVDFKASASYQNLSKLTKGDKFLIAKHTDEKGIINYGTLYIVGQDGSGKNEFHIFYPGMADGAVQDIVHKITGGATLSIKDIQDEIDKKIKGTQADLVNINSNTETSLKLLQEEIELMNDGGQTHLGMPGFYPKEKQDKFADDQFIETAEVQYMDLSAISSAAGISADLSGVKKEVEALKNRDKGLQGTIDGMIIDINGLKTANPDIARIDGEVTNLDTKLKALETQEASDITAVQKEIKDKADLKADKTTVNAVSGRITTAEGKITKLENNAGTQAATVATHTTEISGLTTTTATHTSTLQQHGALLTAHGEGIKDNTDDIKDLKSLVSFMGIYTPASLPVSGGDVKAKFGEAKLGMFAFVKASATGDLYQIWTAEAQPVGGIPQATGDWIHEVGADIQINMKPYLEMEMKPDGSRQVGPSDKGEVIYGDPTDATNNKWVNLKTVIEDAFAIANTPIAKPEDTLHGKVMTIINKGTDAAPDYQLEFQAGQLTGTDELQDITGVWSDVQTPKEGDMVVVRKVDVNGVITAVGGSTRKPVLGDTEFDGTLIEYVPKTDGENKIAIGGSDSTKLVYVDNPTDAEFLADDSRRVFAFDSGESKGSWKPLPETEISGKANFAATTNDDQIVVVESVDGTTGNVKVKPINLTLANIQDISTKADNNETEIADLKNFDEKFNTMADNGYVFKNTGTDYKTKTLRVIGAELKDGANYDDDDDRLMSEKEINTAIKGSLETRQKELINFQQQSKKPDGTLIFEADGVTPVMEDLPDDDKPVKYTQKKDTSFTQISQRATDAANAIVDTVAGESRVSLMVGRDDSTVAGTLGPINDDLRLVSKKYIDEHGMRDVSDLAGEALWNALAEDTFYIIKTKTSTTADAISDEKVIIEVHSKDDTAGIKFTAIALDNKFHTSGELTFAKPAAGDKTDLPEVVAIAAEASTTTIIKNKGKVSDYMADIAKAEAENKLVRLWHKMPGLKRWDAHHLRAVKKLEASSDGKYIIAGTSGALYNSEDFGATWNQRKSFRGDLAGLAASTSGQYVVTATTNLFTAADTFIWVSNDYGKTWTQPFTLPLAGHPQNNFMSVAISGDGKYMIAGSQDKKIYISKDFGVTWTTALTGLGWIEEVAMSLDGQYMIGGEENGHVYVSSDHGLNWSSKTIISGGRDRAIWAAAVSTSGQYMAIGCENNDIYVSKDNGANWTKAKTTGGAVRTIVMSDNGQYMASTNETGQIWMSNDKGVTWTNPETAGGRAGGLEMTPDGKHLIAGFFGDKAYTSDNYGVTWTATTSPMGNIFDVTISNDGSRMTVGSLNQNVYVALSATEKHHHALVHEVDKEEEKVYSSENGKTVEIGNLQLSDTYHLEIEVKKGTKITDGTSTDGVATPTVITPDAPTVVLPTTTTYTLTFDDGTTQKVKIEETT